MGNVLLKTLTSAYEHAETCGAKMIEHVSIFVNKMIITHLIQYCASIMHKFTEDKKQICSLKKCCVTAT